MRLTREPTSIFEQESEFFPDILVTYFVTDMPSVTLGTVKSHEFVDIDARNLDKLVKHIKQNIKNLE